MCFTGTDLPKAETPIQPECVILVEGPESYGNTRIQSLLLQPLEEASSDSAPLVVGVYHQFSDMDVVGTMFDDTVPAFHPLDAYDLMPLRGERTRRRSREARPTTPPTALSSAASRCYGASRVTPTTRPRCWN